ncbi:S1C family serine protease [Paenibacillus aurantiacus]|uniref:S1C family serine protease n=1 Tax=Paenibacillus aurantiacus TaxID=1936118 RepID=A0ABV5KQB4_9BACL
MDDNNKKHPFDDFFHDNAEQNQNDEQKETTASADHTQEEKPSYYYSYGPFKQNSVEAGEPARAASANDNAATDYARSETVEVTPPTQLRPFAPTQQARNGWQVKEKSRTSFKTIFASFMVGVVAVGGLMVYADKSNMFGGTEALTSQPVATQVSTAASDGSKAKVSNAADVVRPNNIAQIFETASPAVVKIETYVRQQSSGNSMLNDPFFRQFFGDDFGQGNGGQGDSGQSSGELTLSGLGTGFFFDSNGYILTNQHVLGDADEIRVTVEGHSEPLVAKKLGASFDLDLAVLKVEGTGFPTLPIGNADNTQIGDWVVAIGNPIGFDHTVTVGVLSAKERPISISDTEGDRNYEHLLQTDASINPGNSGGPLLNLQGEVIGINTAVSSQAQGIGFAIPTSTIMDNLEALKANKEIPKKPAPFIGATLTNITADAQKELGLTSTDGSIVMNVAYKSPAYMADLRQYDVITGIGGTAYKTKEDLIAEIQKRAVGDKVVLNVVRGGQKIDITVEIGNKNDFPQLQQ